MTYDIEISMPITELLASQNEEIAKYKWCESQRQGHDIGWQRASEEWFEKHFGDWVRAQRGLIDDALRPTQPPRGRTGVRGKPEVRPLRPR